MSKGVAIIVGLTLLVILSVTGAVFLAGLIVWALWNALVPELFDGPQVSYWQAVLIGLALSFVGGLLGRPLRIERRSKT